MALAYTGRIFNAAMEMPNRLGILWDGQIYDLTHGVEGLLVIPKDAEAKKNAERFIAFASAPDRLAALADLTAYGPMRQSAIRMVGKHPSLGVEMAPYIPTGDDRLAHGLKFDSLWWNAHGGEIAKRFADWRNGVDSSEKTASDSAPSAAKP